MLLRIDKPQLLKVDDDQGQDQYVYGENTDKIRKRTTWRPQISLDMGISECVEELEK